MRVARPLIAVLTLLLGALVPFVPRAGAATTPDPAPAVGTCHAMSWATYAGLSDPAPDVPCSGTHQTITVANVTLPTDISRTDDQAQWPYYGRVCIQAWARAIGGWARADMSMYGFGKFVPTTDQWNAGSRWVRCDLSLKAAGERLQPLPAQPNSPLTTATKMCRTGSSTGYAAVPCTSRHQFRATLAPHLSSWTSFRTALDKVRGWCARRLSVPFLAEAPRTKQLYNWGDTYGVCLPQTRT